ncbi:MAG: hypothetical protein ACK55Z_19900, partial [bacterium]
RQRLAQVSLQVDVILNPSASDLTACVQFHIHLQLILERFPDQAQHLSRFGRVGCSIPCHQGAFELESTPARQCLQVSGQLDHSFLRIGSCNRVIHIGPELEVPGRDRHIRSIPLCSFPQGCYRNAPGRAIPKVHRRADVYSHFLGIVAVPPHDPPHVLGQLVRFHPLVKFGQILGQCISILSEAEGDREQVHQC